MQVVVRLVAGALVILGAIAFYIWVCIEYPIVLSQFKAITYIELILINLLYLASIASLLININAIVGVAGKQIALHEGLQITAYSSLVNFFIPGQFGPGVRAVYLKVKHGIPIKIFMTGVFLYMAWLIVLSGLMLIFAYGGWFWLLLLCAAIGVATITVHVLFVGKRYVPVVVLQNAFKYGRLTVLTGIGTLLQVAILAMIYYIELSSVDSGIKIRQVIVYTGMANFSLFVSITPGAIGVREGLLVLTQGIHNIASSKIVAANAIDRASYLMVLMELGAFLVFNHARDEYQLLRELVLKKM